jgi:hypothetical protein
MSWRSREPSRIEGFSDAVFGFALTLLVVTLDVPRTFDELMTVVRGFLPFAFTFATIAWLWYEHYAFFRRFDPDDRVTIALNCALLFMVVFYAYPLKFLYTLVVTTMLGEPAFARALTRPGDGVKLMVIYGLGWIAVFVIFALLHANVWRRRAGMQLTALEMHDARSGTVSHLLAAGVGVFSVALVLAGGDRMSMWSGVSYSLLGPVLGTWGYIAGRERHRLGLLSNPGSPQSDEPRAPGPDEPRTPNPNLEPRTPNLEPTP